MYTLNSMKFKHYITRNILNEDVPVSGEYDTWYPSLRTGVSTRSQTNDVYLFKDIASALNITVQTAVDQVSQRLFDRLFPNNQPNPANTEEEFRDAIFNALTEIVNEINQQAGTDIKNSKSQKSYTARIISSLGQTVKTFNGAAPRAVRAVINQVNQQVVQEEPVVPPPPVTEIDKLKKKLHSIGYGKGIDIAPQIIKSVYGITDIDNIITRDYVQLILKTKEKCLAMDKTLPAHRVVSSMSGFLYRYAPSVTVPFFIPEDGRRDFFKHLLDPAPRIKISYSVAVANKFVSASGRKCIQSLVDNYGVVVGDVYFTLTLTRSIPALYTIVSLKTVTDKDITYTEFNTVDKKTYDRELRSYASTYSLHKYNKAISGYDHRRVERQLYLR
jgi:hypothetical protein